MGFAGTTKTSVRRKSLRTVLDVEFDRVTLIQALIPAGCNGIEVDEYIFAAARLSGRHPLPWLAQARVGKAEVTR